MTGKTTAAHQVTSYPWAAKAIVPSDSANLQGYDNKDQPMTVRVGVAGTVVFLPVNNDPANTITLSCVAGEILPCIVLKVLAGGTTATGLVGFY